MQSRTTTAVKTIEQVKAEFRSKGVTFASIAKENGWRRQDVYKVLNGQSKETLNCSRNCSLFWPKTTRVMLAPFCTMINKRNLVMSDNNIVSVVLFSLTIFSFSGWYFAENDNEILRKELSQYTSKEVRNRAQLNQYQKH